MSFPLRNLNLTFAKKSQSSSYSQYQLNIQTLFYDLIPETCAFWRVSLGFNSRELKKLVLLLQATGEASTYVIKLAFRVWQLTANWYL